MVKTSAYKRLAMSKQGPNARYFNCISALAEYIPPPFEFTTENLRNVQVKYQERPVTPWKYTGFTSRLVQRGGVERENWAGEGALKYPRECQLLT